MPRRIATTSFYRFTPLSFLAFRKPAFPKITDVIFSGRDSLVPDLPFTRRIRIEDAFDRFCGIVRVFDSADSLAPSFDMDVPSHTKA
jgi:hypothetical protein